MRELRFEQHGVGWLAKVSVRHREAGIDLRPRSLQWLTEFQWEPLSVPVKNSRQKLLDLVQNVRKHASRVLNRGLVVTDGHCARLNRERCAQQEFTPSRQLLPAMGMAGPPAVLADGGGVQ